MTQPRGLERGRAEGQAKMLLRALERRFQVAVPSPVGSLSRFALGLGPAGIDLFEVDSRGDVFAQGLFGSTDSRMEKETD